ncbi:hypothetical protein I3842_06G016800 [Carya illinoinensis]|uniref:Uncharacterized protein n=1 Tax=Carya illinoinensis TaxID=32201 RepID=A0A922JH42_CARIL|nr:hypothetical protein I3842_06G016800 [Carya illinoinensis]
MIYSLHILYTIFSFHFYHDLTFSLLQSTRFSAFLFPSSCPQKLSHGLYILTIILHPVGRYIKKKNAEIKNAANFHQPNVWLACFATFKLQQAKIELSISKQVSAWICTKLWLLFFVFVAVFFMQLIRGLL